MKEMNVDYPDDLDLDGPDYLKKLWKALMEDSPEDVGSPEDVDFPDDPDLEHLDDLVYIQLDPRQSIRCACCSAVDYGSQDPPRSYRCNSCGAGGCKLWKLWTRKNWLYCAECGTRYFSLINNIDAKGRRTNPITGIKSTTMEELVPAIPYENSEDYWGCCYIPRIAMKWWEQLPTNPPINPRFKR